MIERSRTVLVTGANGFVGAAVCAAAAARGWRVRGAVRSARELSAGAEPIVVGTVNGSTDWTCALEGADAVIHLAARVHVMVETSSDPLADFRELNVHATRNLAEQAVHAGVRRFVYVSSVKVNGEETRDGLSFSDADVPAPEDPYGISKWEAEQALRQVSDATRLEVVVVRPPLVYGPGVRGNFIQMLRIVSRGVPLPFASVRNSRDLVYLANLADALITCVAHPAAVGKTYLISDGEGVSTPSLLRQVASALGVSSRLLPFPPALLRLAGQLTGRSSQVERLLGSLRVDGGRIRSDLQWSPPYSFREGIAATATWFRSTQST
jgi:nucleoside-diphosphate-sugar epimerase